MEPVRCGQMWDRNRLTDRGTPDGERLRAGKDLAGGRVAVDEVAVGIVLDHEIVGHENVVKHLGAEDVTADAPRGAVALGHEPVVANRLDVGVVDFKRAVVHALALGVLAEKERVVVDPLLAAVDVRKARHVDALGVVQNVGGDEVKVGGEKFKRAVKVAHEAGVRDV